MYACMIRKLCLLMLLASAILSVSACSDTETAKTDPNATGVSPIPWDRPEKWENGSSLPGGFQGSR